MSSDTLQFHRAAVVLERPRITDYSAVITAVGGVEDHHIAPVRRDVPARLGYGSYAVYDFEMPRAVDDLVVRHVLSDEMVV